MPRARGLPRPSKLVFHGRRTDPVPAAARRGQPGWRPRRRPGDTGLWPAACRFAGGLPARRDARGRDGGTGRPHGRGWWP
jgi:hypothetical protein